MDESGDFVPGFKAQAMQMSFKTAYSDPDWKAAIERELNPMISKKWIENCVGIPPTDATIIPVTFRFTIKDDGTKKARMCARGDLQQTYAETASTVVTKVGLKIMLTDAAIHDLEIYQFDVGQAFCQTKMNVEGKPVYLKKPRAYRELFGDTNEFWKSNVYLYGMKEAGREWGLLFRSFMEENNFYVSPKDDQIYTKQGIMVGVHVDDGIIAGNKAEILQFIDKLESKWKIRHGDVNNYVGWQISRDRPNRTIWINQSSYISQNILEEFGADVQPFPTPMDPNFSPITHDDDAPCHVYQTNQYSALSENCYFLPKHVQIYS